MAIFIVLSFCRLKRDPLQFGIDVLQKNNFEALKDAGNIGFLTHLASTNSDNVPSCDIFIEANKAEDKLNGRLKCFFSPEHGFGGKKEAGQHVENEIYKGIEVRSLYNGDILKIKTDIFKGIDSLVIDLRDIGVRYYCYNTCMRFALEEAIKQNKKVFILDRPNPLGRKISGLLLEKELQAYVGGFCIPHVYGMTMGELANMIVKNYIPHPWLSSLTEEELRRAKDLLTVIRVENWNPEKLWSEQTFKKGYRWHGPSPNIPCFDSAKAYTCSIAVSAYGNFTTRFHDEKSDACVDKSWIQPFVFWKILPGKEKQLEKICERMKNWKLPGISFELKKIDKVNKEDEEEQGIVLNITNWEKFDPWLCVINALYLDRQLDKENNMCNKFEALGEKGLRYQKENSEIPFSKYYKAPDAAWEVIRSIIGNKALLNCLSNDELTEDKIKSFIEKSQQDCSNFENMRKDWLLY